MHMPLLVTLYNHTAVHDKFCMLEPGMQTRSFDTLLLQADNMQTLSLHVPGWQYAESTPFHKHRALVYRTHQATRAKIEKLKVGKVQFWDSAAGCRHSDAVFLIHVIHHCSPHNNGIFVVRHDTNCLDTQS